ncbi:MAG: nucleotide exchange factor GrpE [Actinomycetota bacterium]
MKEEAPAGDTESGETLERVVAELRDLTVAVAELTERIGQDRDRAAHREAVIDRLHEENQRLKAGETNRILDPILRDLIRLHDELERTARSWAGQGDPSPSEVAENFASIALEVELILGRLGVERFSARPGDSFSRHEHRAVGALDADDASLENTVAEVLRSGFRTGERPIRPVEVKIFRALPGASTASIAREAGRHPPDPLSS